MVLSPPLLNTSHRIQTAEAGPVCGRLNSARVPWFPDSVKPMPQYWHVRQCSLFAMLTAAQLSRLEQHARVRTVPRHSIVYLPQDASEHAFLLADGRVRIGTQTPDGRSATLSFIEPGELFGELELLQAGPRQDMAETLLPSTIVMLPSAALRQIMEQSPQLTLSVTRLMGFRRQRIERRLQHLLFRSNRERLVHLLLELAESYGRQTPQGVQLGIRLSHQDFAALIGTTRESVTLGLGELQAEGLLTVRRQSLFIQQLDRLALCVGAAPPRIAALSAVEQRVRAFRDPDQRGP